MNITLYCYSLVKFMTTIPTFFFYRESLFTFFLHDDKLNNAIFKVNMKLYIQVLHSYESKLVVNCKSRNKEKM